jgi:NAD(P)-dependent dehydrogenase (short-subunit alcohol dehydrogenase family)
VMDAQALQQAVRQIVRNHGRIDLCLYCAGYYQPMRAQQFSLDEAMRHLDINYVGALKLLQALLPQLLLQAHQGQPGHISLVSSVAGYRGLPKSLAYGPSKAALSHLAEALYLDLSPEKIGVSVINPGFVATPLTAQNDFAMPALITAEQAAQEILKGWARGEFEIHFPKRFTLWLKLLRHLGHGLYFRAVRRATGL